MTFEGFSLGGRLVRFECRESTHDYATCVHLLAKDEYGLRNLVLPEHGFAVDIGAYTGALAVSLAVDGWYVIAVEPLPDNQEMIEQNADLNDTAVVVDGRAASHVDWVDISYGFPGDHFYVGDLEVPGPLSIRKSGVTVSQLMAEYDLDQIDLLKIDCEGCEWGVLADPAVKNIETIVGEIHGRPQDELRALLSDHNVKFLNDYVFQATQ